MHTPNFTLLPINNHLQLELLSLTDEKTSFSLFLLNKKIFLSSKFLFNRRFCKSYENFFAQQKNMTIFVSMSRFMSIYMPYLCNLFFIFSVIFIAINHIITLSRCTCFGTFFKNLS